MCWRGYGDKEQTLKVHIYIYRWYVVLSVNFKELSGIGFHSYCFLNCTFESESCWVLGQMETVLHCSLNVDPHTLMVLNKHKNLTYCEKQSEENLLEINQFITYFALLLGNLAISIPCTMIIISQCCISYFIFS